jgi:hypothetical protein
VLQGYWGRFRPRLHLLRSRRLDAITSAAQPMGRESGRWERGTVDLLGRPPRGQSRGLGTLGWIGRCLSVAATKD